MLLSTTVKGYTERSAREINVVIINPVGELRPVWASFILRRGTPFMHE